jgi:hypothetical protein
VNYLLDILRIVDDVRARRGLSIRAACRHICECGGLRWVDSSLQTVAEVDNADTLTVRYHDAKRARLQGQRRAVRSVKTFTYERGAKRHLKRRDRFVFLP